MDIHSVKNAEVIWSKRECHRRGGWGTVNNVLRGEEPPVRENDQY